MKLKNLFFIAFAAIVALTGCKKEVNLISFSVSSNTVTLTEAGQTMDVTVTPMPADATVNFEWTSDKTDVATVSKTGDLTAKITAVANGTATITVKSGVKEKTVSVTVNIGSTPPPPPPSDGDGSKEKPYTVAQAIDSTGATTTVNGWVGGYIVGGVIDDGGTITNLTNNPEGYVFNYSNVRSTCVFIADSPNETNTANVLIVKLNDATQNPTDMRAALNLVDNCANYKTYIKVTGAIYRYFSVPGIREITAYEGGGLGSEGCGGSEPPAESELLNETLLTQESFGKFTAVNVIGDLGWNLSTTYGAMMSGFADSRSYQNEDWFISPAVDLSSVSNATLSFMHARGPEASINVGIANNWYQVFVTGNYTGDVATTTWTELTNVTHGTAKWTFVNSGDLAIPAAAKTATMRFAFKYRCSDTESATWEIKNVILKGE
jgi:hypothetical protein